MSHTSNSKGRIWLGAILIIAGTLFFLRNFHFNIINFDILSWPVILIVVGLIILYNQRGSFFGMLLILAGGVGIVSKYFHMSFRNVISEYWPIFLILIGIYTIFKTFGSKEKDDNNFIEGNEHYLDIFSIFGEKNKRVKTNDFLGGKLTSLFSDLKIDLRDSKITHGIRELDTLTIFGATEISLPNDWDVIIKTTTIFGGFEDHRSRALGEDEDEKRVLVIKGLVLFGGGEIKS